MTLDDYVRAIGLPSGGAVRASLGLVSNTADIKRFVAFAASSSTSPRRPPTSPPAPAADAETRDRRARSI